MNVTQVLVELRAERKRIEEAILALERLELGRKVADSRRPRKGPPPEAPARTAAAKDNVN